MLGGVCGGFAHYLNFDPIAVRIILIALLFTGVGLLAYLIAWIAIPSAEEGDPGRRSSQRHGIGPRRS